MALFKKKSSAFQPEIREVIFEQHFTQSHSFKGFKRFNVSYYGYRAAEDGLAKFKAAGAILEGADIFLQGIRRNDNVFVEVYVNECLLGSVTMWADDACSDFIRNELFKGKVEKAHIRVETENVLSKSGAVQRDKIFLFLR